MSMPWGTFEWPRRPTVSWKAAEAARRQFTSRSKSATATMFAKSASLKGAYTAGA